MRQKVPFATTAKAEVLPSLAQPERPLGGQGMALIRPHSLDLPRRAGVVSHTMLTTNAALAGAHRTHPKDQRRGLSPLPALLATLFCGLFLLAGCGPGLPDADEGAREGILLTGNGGDPRRSTRWCPPACPRRRSSTRSSKG
jgi:hypothetical protein